MFSPIFLRFKVKGSRFKHKKKRSYNTGEVVTTLHELGSEPTPSDIFQDLCLDLPVQKQLLLALNSRTINTIKLLSGNSKF